jgi:uncharacterized protein
MKCPICEKPVAPRPENTFFPFCSDRCRMADLGKWLNEDYKIPGPPAADVPPPPDEDED